MATDSSALASTEEAGHTSHLAYRRYFYAKLALAVVAAAALLYALHDPLLGAHGGTWLGYGLGTVSLGLMGWLAWFGVRKRQYQTGRGAARAWVSAHVYLGLALLVLVTLHSGFRVSWSIHGFAYVLLCGVVLSGLYGVLVYATLPKRITDNRRDLPPRAMLAEIQRLDDTALRLADKSGPEIHAIVSRSVANVRIGGNAWQQITGRYPGRDDRGLRALAEKSRDASRRAATAASVGQPQMITQQMDRMETVAVMADQLFESNRRDQADSIKRILDLLTQRKALVERLNRDVSLRARLNIWLYLHVPLTIGLIAAVIGHLLAVFFYF